MKIDKNTRKKRKQKYFNTEASHSDESIQMNSFLISNVNEG